MRLPPHVGANLVEKLEDVVIVDRVVRLAPFPPGPD